MSTSDQAQQPEDFDRMVASFVEYVRAHGPNELDLSLIHI